MPTLLFLACSVDAAEPPAQVLPHSPQRPPVVRLDTQTPFFQLRSDDVFGARGRETVNVSVPTICGQTQWVFDHAELLVGTVRYGGAYLRSAPKAGCTRCSPLVVDWYHEPTGKLSFSLNVFRRATFKPCTTASGPETQ